MGWPMVRVCLHSAGREAEVWTLLGASIPDSLFLHVVSGLLLLCVASPLHLCMWCCSRVARLLTWQQHNQEAKIETASPSEN